MIKKYVGYLALSSLLFILIACGGAPGGDGAPAPETATITINPASMTVSCVETAPPMTTFDSITIAVTDTRTGIPLNRVELTIFYPWAVPNTSAVQFYHEGGPVNSPLTVTTDDHGTYTLNFSYQVCDGASYFGDFEVTSGNRYAAAEFTVEATTATP